VADRQGGETEGAADGHPQGEHGGDGVEDAAEGHQEQDHREDDGDRRGEGDVPLAGGHLLMLQERGASHPHRYPGKLGELAQGVDLGTQGAYGGCVLHEAGLVLDREDRQYLLTPGGGEG